MLLALPLLLFILFICLSCVRGSNYPYNRVYNTKPIQTVVYIDTAFTFDEENIIANALKSWECSSDHMLRYKIIYNTQRDDYSYADPKASLFIWKVNGDDPRIKTTDEVFAKSEADNKLITVGLFIAADEDHSAAILLPIERTIGRLFAISAHEIGHFSIGNEHAQDKNSVMYKTVDEGSKTITHIDILALCEKHNFDPSRMRVCNIQ